MPLMSLAEKLRRARVILLSATPSRDFESPAEDAAVMEGLGTICDVLHFWCLQLEGEPAATTENPPLINMAFCDSDNPLKNYVRVRGESPERAFALLDRAEEYVRRQFPVSCGACGDCPSCPASLPEMPHA